MNGRGIDICVVHIVWRQRYIVPRFKPNDLLASRNEVDKGIAADHTDPLRIPIVMFDVQARPFHFPVCALDQVVQFAGPESGMPDELDQEIAADVAIRPQVNELFVFDALGLHVGRKSLIHPMGFIDGERELVGQRLEGRQFSLVRHEQAWAKLYKATDCARGLLMYRNGKGQKRTPGPTNCGKLLSASRKNGPKTKRRRGVSPAPPSINRSSCLSYQLAEHSKPTSSELSVMFQLFVPDGAVDSMDERSLSRTPVKRYCSPAMAVTCPLT